MNILPKPIIEFATLVFENALAKVPSIICFNPKL